MSCASNDPRKLLGYQAEQFVAKQLQKQGYTILDQNYTVKDGELDLIACKDNMVLFVEVKARRSDYFPLSEVITPSKQRKVVRAARHFVLNRRLGGYGYRFDVALVHGLPGAARLEYLENAFIPSLESMW